MACHFSHGYGQSHGYGSSWPSGLALTFSTGGFLLLWICFRQNHVYKQYLYLLSTLVPLTSVRLGPCHMSDISGSPAPCWVGVQGTLANDMSLTRVDLQMSLHVLHAVGSLELAT